MSRRFILTEPAARDLDEIFVYILKESGADRARYVVERLYTSFQKLAETPSIGHRRPDLTDAPVLFWRVWSYLVIYRSGNEPLEIVRVLHGARDLSGLLGDMG